MWSKYRAGIDILAETESTRAQDKPWMAWRGVDRCWLVDLPEIASKSGNK